ncbi:MAG: hypothetical protein PHC53_01140 [Patescibacteria group bacterium]|nr:hypothetical protein [Patescibacteria group bacterium]
MNKFTWAVLSVVALLASFILGCGGKDFTAAPSEVGDSSVEDAKPDKQHDANKPDADAKDTGMDQETSLPEASTEAGVEAEASLPEASPDVELPDAVEEISPLGDCQQWGNIGFVTVVIRVNDEVPLSQVLAVYGKYSFAILDSGIPQDYAPWKFGNQGEKLIVAMPTAAVIGLDIVFEPGFTTPGNNDLSTWDIRCDQTGCPATDEYLVCAGKNFVGKCSGDNCVKDCDYQMDVHYKQQVHCTLKQ